MKTIVAIATPPGKGGVGIIRISGSKVKLVALNLLKRIPKPRKAEFLPFFGLDGSILDRGIALFFPSPNSFTGENVLELQCHGSPVLMDLLIENILYLEDVRLAKPGEFLERAFLNEKLDLTQAEAIADLINTDSIKSAKAALRSISGLFSKKVKKISKKITNLRVYIESSINFPEEVINLISYEQIKNNLNDIIDSIDKLKNISYQNSLLKEKTKIVISGEPNVGKSSLFNILVGFEFAIVTNIAGTTRDALHEDICLDNMLINIVDTAGLRSSKDKIEILGIERTWKEIDQADHILYVVDASNNKINYEDNFLSEIKSRRLFNQSLTIIRNKIDLTKENESEYNNSNYWTISISTKSGKGIDLLRNHLKKRVGLSKNVESNFLARRRHIYALEKTLSHLINSREKINNKINFDELLIAEEINLAQKSIDEITGLSSSEELLNKIFSTFCIGK